jgi:hypothetical protein
MKRIVLFLPLLACLGAAAQHNNDHYVQALGGNAASTEHSVAYDTVLLDEEPPTPEAELELVSFEASSTGHDGVLVRWTAINEQPGDLYRVERSNDLLSWYPATQLVVTTTRDGYIAHQTIDRAPFNGVSYYRLMHVGSQGEQELSDLFSVRHDLGNDLVIHDGHAPGHFVVLASGSISEMQLLNNRGQFIPMDLFLDGERVRVNAELLEPGTYYVQAVVNGKRTMRPVIIGNGGVIGG